MGKIVKLPDPAAIYACCYSDRFPEDPFDVYMQPSAQEIPHREKIISVLKSAQVYGGELENQEAQTYTFRDDYINVILQRQLDGRMEVPEATWIKNRLTTPNEYKAVEDLSITADAFCDAYTSETVIYTSVFIRDPGLLTDPAFLERVETQAVCKQLDYHFIFYYVTDLSAAELQKLFTENYDENNQYFYNAPTTDGYMIVRYRQGIRQ